jgi:hypothetical protein
MEDDMSNTKYVDPTIATDPPGGKVHDVGKSDAQADKLPTEQLGDHKKRGGKTAASPKTVANTEK